MDLDVEPLRDLTARIPQMRDGEATEFCNALVTEIQKHVAKPGAETPAFLSAAYEALKTLSAQSPSSRLVEGLISIGHYYALATNPAAGLAPAADAVAVARLCDNQPLWMKALRLKAWLLGDSGNFPDAVASVSDALTMARNAGDVTAECACWNSLGVYFHQAGQSKEAISYFDRAIELAGDDPDRRGYKDVARSNIGLAALDVGDIRRAFAAAQEAVADQSEPKDAADADTRAMQEQMFARVLVEVGDVKRAEGHLKKAQKYAKLAGTERSRLVVAATQSLVEIASGHPDIGLTRMKKTLEDARSRSKGQLPALLSFAVTGYDRGNQPTVALSLMHELLDLKKESAQAQILMHHRLHMASIDAATTPEDAGAVALADRHSQLRIRSKENALTERNLRILEQQSVAAELHDDTTGEHCYRVGKLAGILGKEIDLEEDVCFLIGLSARLHDIGKLVVPDAILLKPGKLTPGEREIMQKHTTSGADILARTGLPQIHIAEAIARHHHERWDGNGYPDRLSGSSIPLAARVTALADVFDALTHKRPYKEAWPVHAALAEIKELSGKQFDPELCEIFLDLIPRLQREMGDLDYFLGSDAKNADFIKARRSIAAALKGSDPSVSLFDLRR